VTVPIISGASAPGPVPIYLSATPASWSAGDPSSTQQTVTLYSSPDAVPPTITSVQLVTQGKLATGVVLGFSKPMAQATVEDIHNYRILSQPIMIDHNSLLGRLSSGLFGGLSATMLYHSFPIAAATYDPSASTVTLTLKRPAKASSLYEIANAYPLTGHELTDLEGQAATQGDDPGILFLGGGFTALVHPNPRVFLSPVGPLRSTMAGSL
jgi:hypothetical protein